MFEAIAFFVAQQIAGYASGKILDRAISQSNLATVYIELKMLDKAFNLWLSAYKIFNNTFGADHRNTQIVLQFLFQHFKDRLK